MVTLSEAPGLTPIFQISSGCKGRPALKAITALLRLSTSAHLLVENYLIQAYLCEVIARQPS